MQSQLGLKQHPRYLALSKALVVTLLTAASINTFCSGPDDRFLISALHFCDLPEDLLKSEQRQQQLVLSSILIQLPLVFAIYQGALKTRGAAKAMVTLQVFVLSFFCQWLAWTKFALQTSPLSMLIGLAAGCIWGHVDMKHAAGKQDASKDKLIISIKEKELKEAHLQLVKQDEADRRILASDLHDQVLNDLKSLRLAVGALKQLTDQESIDASVVEIESSIDQTTGQVREVMENLTPSVLENLGLASALDDLLRRSGSRGKFKVRFKNDASDGLGKLSKIEELLLFRTVQEALSNTIKHARAQRVELVLAQQEGELVISLFDDGLGIPPDKERGQSRGLRYMRQRADLMGARIAWKPGRESKGCLVEIKIQLKEA